MMRWSYVGSLGKDDALDWGGNYDGNSPASGHYLPDWDDTKLYLRIRGYAREGAFEGRQTDWGTYALKVNGPELLTILEEAYGSTTGIDPKTLLGRYAAFARKLGTENYIPLISAEM
ncbi:MAG: hypothetical protein NVS3B5_20630 [Sphingomicrobium sp.]